MVTATRAATKNPPENDPEGSEARNVQGTAVPAGGTSTGTDAGRKPAARKTGTPVMVALVVVLVARVRESGILEEQELGVLELGTEVLLPLLPVVETAAATAAEAMEAEMATAGVVTAAALRRLLPRSRIHQRDRHLLSRKSDWSSQSVGRMLTK